MSEKINGREAKSNMFHRVWSNMLVEYFFSCSARALRSRSGTFSTCHGSAPPGGCSARPYMISYRSRATLDLPCTGHSKCRYRV